MSQVPQRGPEGRPETSRPLHARVTAEMHTRVLVLLQIEPEDIIYFHDWKRHIWDTHPTCLVGEEDPLFVEEYTAGFNLDSWHRLHGITGDELDQLFLRVSRLRNDYGQYQGKREGTKTPAPGPASTIRLPNSKGATPNRHQTPTGLELADSEIGGTDFEESGDGQEVGEVQDQEEDVFTGIGRRGSDSESDNTSHGWDARSREAPPATPVPRSRGWGKKSLKKQTFMWYIHPDMNIFSH